MSNLAAEFGFFQNYALGLWTHTWSLAVEEHFYILLSVVILFLSRRGLDRLPVLLCGTCVVVLALRVLTWGSGQHSELATVFPSHLRIDSLALGVLISWFHHFQGERLSAIVRKYDGWIAPASILLLSPVTFRRREDAFMVTIGFSMVAWGFGLLLVNILYPAKPLVLGALGRKIAALGRVSYGFYLWHGPIILWTDALALPVFISFGVTFALTTLVAVATTQAIEIPFLRLRDRWTGHIQGRAIRGREQSRQVA